MKAIVPTLALLLLLPAATVTPPSPAPDGPSGSVAARSSAPTLESAPAFCLEGPVMAQLLQGFGCAELAGRVESSRLNCTTRILREEVVDGQARLDLVIECECEDARAGDAPLRRLDGEWRMIVDL